MTTIARRIVSIPARSSTATWDIIATLLSPKADSEGRKEVTSVKGIASSLIAEEAMKEAPIVVYGSGPRVRVYCLYDDDAIAGDDANEDALPFDSTAGDWHMSLPCPADDLEWVRGSLKKLTTRITARDMTTSVDDAEKMTTNEDYLNIQADKEAFFRP